MDQPIAYLITWTTYGTWLHGDERGSFDHKGNYIRPDIPRRELARAAMVGDSIVLTPEQRAIVDGVFVEHCRIRGWVLHARNVRTNHVHAVVSAPVDGEKVREEIKAWASRRLTEHARLPRAMTKHGARKWWTEKGNVEPIWNDQQLESAVQYVDDQ